MQINSQLNKIYHRCNSEGKLIPQQEIDTIKISSMIKLSKEDLQSSKILVEHKQFNSAFKLLYDSTHLMCEAFLLFDKIKSSNHQCLFTYLCFKYKKLNFSWNFFELIRKKRNGINYYGESILEKDWEKIQTQTIKYINILRKETKTKLTLYN